MKVLVVDVGGSNVKVLASGMERRRTFPSGKRLTPTEMLAGVRAIAARLDLQWDVATIGVPAPVRSGRVLRDPANLGPGWVDFDFQAALQKPIKLVNDAAMQALGSYEGGRMVFMGLGTGLGTALVDDGHLVGLEIAHMPYREGTYEDWTGDPALARLGLDAWRRSVAEVAEILRQAFVAEYVVLGGGNVRRFDVLPPHCRRGSNANAFRGGFRLWGVEADLAAIDRRPDRRGSG